MDRGRPGSDPRSAQLLSRVVADRRSVVPLRSEGSLGRPSLVSQLRPSSAAPKQMPSTASRLPTPPPSLSRSTSAPRPSTAMSGFIGSGGPMGSGISLSGAKQVGGGAVRTVSYKNIQFAPPLPPSTRTYGAGAGSFTITGAPMHARDSTGQLIGTPLLQQQAPSQLQSLSSQPSLTTTSSAPSMSSSGGPPPLPPAPSGSLQKPVEGQRIIPSEDSKVSLHSYSLNTKRDVPDTRNVPVIARTEEERRINPERLNLDRRKLTIVPILEGENKLRLLNLQNNSLTTINNLRGLPELIFLDFYNNQIKKISSLESVPTLRVLMLGKNRIIKIEGLEPLSRLDVLDLHSNAIEIVENLQHLRELRVLNLAGNMIRNVDNLIGLDALTELNLRRNQIESVSGLDELPSLQRVFLSNNNIVEFDSIECLFRARALMELALDGNPIAEHPHYRHHVLQNIRTLRHLDMKRITDEERRAVMMLIKQDEARAADRRRLEMFSDDRNTGSDLDYHPPFSLTQHQQREIQQIQSASDSFHGEYSASATPTGALPHISSQSSMSALAGRKSLWEVEGDTLKIYGSGFDGLDVKQNQILPSIAFHQIEIERITPNFSKLKKFNNFTTLLLSNNSISSLHQLSRLAALRQLTVLRVEQNSVVDSIFFRPYLIFRIHTLLRLNGIDVSVGERESAEMMFAGLNQTFTVRSLPHADPLDVPKMSHLMSESEIDYHQQHYAKNTKTDAARAVADAYVSGVIQIAYDIDEKLSAVNEEWPQIVEQFVRNTLLQLEDPETFMRKLIPEDNLV